MPQDRWLVIALAAAVVVLIAGLLVSRLRHGRSPARPARDALDTVMAWRPEVTRVLTQHERQAYKSLVAAFPDHIVLAQVPLARFLKVPKRHSYGEWLHRVGRLTADLLVCNAATEVLAVVEVHSPRDSERSKHRHERMSRVLKAAGVRLVVWIENAIPGVDAARATVLPHPPVQAPTASPSPATPTAARQRDVPTLVTDTMDPALDTQPANEPPSSTWFDDIDSGPAPLSPPRK